MKMLALLFLGSLTPLLRADQDTTRVSPPVDLLPGVQLAPPLRAHPAEPRTGVRKEAGTARLRLDIGAPVDLLHIRLSDAGDRVALGALLFAYGLTTNNDGLRLQVSTVDGFFGGHITAILPRKPFVWIVRLRLLHQSGHLVDGAYDDDTGWRGGRAPVPFTRDFGELLLQLLLDAPPAVLRVYAGGSFTTLHRPDDLGRLGMLAGVELHAPAGRLFARPLNLYAAWNLSLAGRPAWTAAHAVEAGVQLGPAGGRGLRLYGSLTTGPEIFSQYYDLRRTSWGVGFAFDIW